MPRATVIGLVLPVRFQSACMARAAVCFYLQPEKRVTKGEQTMDPTILTEARPGYRIITLNRPERLNAMDGGTFHLPRLVGEGRARALAMLALPVPAEQAAAWGMIWQAVDDTALMQEAETLATHLAAQPTHALVLTRKALRAGLDFDAQLDL